MVTEQVFSQIPGYVDQRDEITPGKLRSSIAGKMDYRVVRGLSIEAQQS
jgi:hypothetical protein